MNASGSKLAMQPSNTHKAIINNQHSFNAYILTSQMISRQMYRRTKPFLKMNTEHTTITSTFLQYTFG